MIKSICAIEVPKFRGWNVRVRKQDGTELYLTTGAPYTLAQAELAASNLRRDIARHGEESICGGLLIGLV